MLLTLHFFRLVRDQRLVSQQKQLPVLLAPEAHQGIELVRYKFNISHEFICNFVIVTTTFLLFLTPKYNSYEINFFCTPIMTILILKPAVQPSFLVLRRSTETECAKWSVTIRPYVLKYILALCGIPSLKKQENYTLSGVCKCILEIVSLSRQSFPSQS